MRQPVKAAAFHFNIAKSDLGMFTLWLIRKIMSAAQAMENKIIVIDCPRHAHVLDDKNCLRVYGVFIS